MDIQEELDHVPFGLGIKNPYGKYFVGQSYLHFLHQGDVGVANVTFEPACRNNWHIHNAKEGGGQILICTYGRGYYQEEGKEAVELLPGSFVYIAPGIKHWHGAAKDSVFCHISLEVPGKETSTTWCEKVRDEDYEKANTVHAVIDPKVNAGHDQLGEIAPEFAHLNDDILFGEVWKRNDYLSLKERSLLTIIALTSSGVIDSSLKFHIQNGKRNGLGLNELSEALTHVAAYIGWPKAWAAFRYVKEVYCGE